MDAPWPSYTKVLLDALIDKRDKLERDAERCNNRLNDIYFEKREVVKQLQEMCHHDEGVDVKYIPNQDTYGKYLASLVNETCKLCHKLVKSYHDKER